MIGVECGVLEMYMQSLRCIVRLFLGLLYTLQGKHVVQSSLLALSEPATAVFAFFRDEMHDLVNGIPSLNLFFCRGGGQGLSFGLWAQICTGLALTDFSGHLGYLVSFSIF